MYKIFINENPLIIASPEEYQSLHTENLMRVECNAPELEALVDWMLRAPSKGYIAITADPDKGFEILKSVTKPIDAAGGVIFNPQRELLMIKRLGYWDLPKGKVDKGESVDFTAIREVKEECGVTGVKIIRKAGLTYHIYHQYPHKMLKTCHWFVMECPDGIVPKPQAEEHIELAIWQDLKELNLDTLETYGTIRELLKTVLEVK
jgi:ADP-ribose pyrophosphatase YjhB (NUDIX family)